MRQICMPETASCCHGNQEKKDDKIPTTYRLGLVCLSFPGTPLGNKKSVKHSHHWSQHVSSDWMNITRSLKQAPHSYIANAREESCRLYWIHYIASLHTLICDSMSIRPFKNHWCPTSCQVSSRAWNFFNVYCYNTSLKLV